MSSDSLDISSDTLLKDIDSFDLKPIDLSRFILKRQINEGGFAKIYLIIEKETEELFVAKILRTKEIKNLKTFFKEVEILKKLDSQFIIKFIGYNLKDFKGKSRPVIITEYTPNGSLDKLIKRADHGNAIDGWNETKKLMIIYGIAKGMSHMHSKGIIHRDLKPPNILIDDYLFPKICDFGLAITQEEIEKEIIEDCVGTPVYLAPEVIIRNEYSKAIDVYAFGLIVYEIVTLKISYDYENIFNIFEDKKKGKKPAIYSDVPLSYKNLIVKCWSDNPKDRPTFDEIVTLLKTDKGFITNAIDYDEYFEFIENTEGLFNITDFKFKKIHIEYPEIQEFTLDLDQIDLNLFEKIKFVGKGQFGKVFQVKNKNTNEFYASKINLKLIQLCKPDEITNLTREITILSKLKSPTILKFIGYSQNNFKNKPKPTIITEFSKNGSLDDIIEMNIRALKPKEWNMTKILITAYGIASGMAYLHSMNILHRDLKPANIFFDDHLFPKIGDFGLSKETDKESHQSPYQIGTIAFMSPEIIKHTLYSKAGDVYAYSIILYEMITYEIPYKGLNFMQVCRKVISGQRPQFNCFVPECYKNLIESCWSNEPSKRPSFEEIVNILENNDEFIVDDVDEDEFRDYIEYIKENKTENQFQQILIDFEELKKLQDNDPTLNISFLELNKFERIKVLRRLDNFKIYQIKNKENSINYEAKISTIKIMNLSKNEIVHLQREINILSKLDHPSFLKFIGYSPIDFNQQPNPVIVTEMPPNRSLEELLKFERGDNHFEEWNATKKLINLYGIASGMSFLHSYNVIHRNLNPESIFIDEFLFPKIGNFGLLTKIHTIASMTFQTTIGIKGNPSYSSPELFENNEYSKSSDVYAFALIAYEIITLEIPFKDINNVNQLFNEVVVNGNRPPIGENIPHSYRQLIEICWSQNTKDRPTFHEIASMLKNDDGFITSEVNKEEFDRYVKMIENAKIEFCSKNKAVCFDDLINTKNKDEHEDINDDGKSKDKGKDKSIDKNDDGKSTDKVENKDKDKNDDGKSKDKGKNKDKDKCLDKNDDKDEDINKNRLDDEYKIKNKDSTKRKKKKIFKPMIKRISDYDDDYKDKDKSRTQSDKIKTSSKIISRPEEKDDNDYDYAKEENKPKSSEAKLNCSITEAIENISNKKHLKSIDSSLNEYLITNSESIEPDLISSNYKYKTGHSSLGDKFVLIKVLKEDFIMQKNKDELNQIDHFKFNQIKSEYKTLNDLNHPNLVNSFGFFDGNDKFRPSILLEFYSHLIKDVIESIEDIYLVTIVYEICNAMMFIHSKNLIHRNLNIDNIFIDSSNHAKISGFGVPILMNCEEQIIEINKNNLLWIPKEILNNEEYDEKVDVFSFGMIMQFILQRGRGPFLAYQDIKDGKKPSIHKKLNKLSFSIISKCLSHSKRPSFKAIVTTIEKNQFQLIDGINIQFIKNHLKSILHLKLQKENNK